MRQSVLRCHRLSFLFGSSGALSYRFSTDFHDDFVGFFVVGTGFGDEFVFRCGTEFCLGYFLKFRLGVDMEGSLEDVVGFEKDVFGDEFAYRLESRVEIERSKERLERVGEDVRVLVASGEGFPTGKEDEFAESDLFGSLREVLSPDEGRTDVGHFAFGFLGKLLIEEFGGNEFEDGVPEEFEPFVGFRKIVFVQHRSVDERRSERLDRRLDAETLQHFGNFVFEPVSVEPESFLGHGPV